MNFTTKQIENIRNEGPSKISQEEWQVLCDTAASALAAGRALLTILAAAEGKK